jgi:hypothetical protein
LPTVGPNPLIDEGGEIQVAAQRGVETFENLGNEAAFR